MRTILIDGRRPVNFMRATETQTTSKLICKHEHSRSRGCCYFLRLDKVPTGTHVLNSGVKNDAYVCVHILFHDQNLDARWSLAPCALTRNHGPPCYTLDELNTTTPVSTRVQFHVLKFLPCMLYLDQTVVSGDWFHWEIVCIFIALL
jgi:hypothetical protein